LCCGNLLIKIPPHTIVFHCTDNLAVELRCWQTMDTNAGESASPPSSNEAAAGSQSQSDVSEEEEYLDNSIELRGYLSKWTNYIYGWQPRYIVLKDGTGAN